MKRELMADEKIAYQNITQRKGKFGAFHKVCFHIHTPASYDYTLLEEWSAQEYINASEVELFNLCIDMKVFPNAILIENIIMDKELKLYKSKKEFFSFLLIANQIFSNSLELVIVADHHTIDGVTKLEVAIKQLHKMKGKLIYPDIILGIEISCADKNHVVGIFENSEKIRNKINSWLEVNLLDVKDGSYKTSLDVLEFIDSVNGIGYIAHMDTSDIFKKNYLNGAYRQRLFSDCILHIIGLSDHKKLEYIDSKIKGCRSEKIKYILDNDSHNINKLSENAFWIKGSKRDYSMIKEAFSDYDISISFLEQPIDKQYVKGMYISNRDNGFLHGNTQQDGFCVDFSDALNCFIGGRGTGKSSVLKILEFVLSQRCQSEKDLDFICAHGNVWIVCIYEGEEYLIGMRMPIKERYEENILNYFGQNICRKYRFDYYFSQENIAEYALRNYLEVSKVKHENDNLYLEPVVDKRKSLKNLFDTTYSVNELVNTASGTRINNFLYNALFENQILAKASDVIRIRKKSGLINMLKDIRTVLQKRKESVEAVVIPFNKMQEGILRILYSQEQQSKAPDLRLWLFGTKYRPQQWYKNYNINHENILEYLHVLYCKVGLWEFLNIAITVDVRKAQKVIGILGFSSEMNQDLIEKGITQLSADKAHEILKSVFEELITDKNIELISGFLKQYVTEIEGFSLEFNINNKEGSQQKAIYKDVRTISLGQKVVAMLSFILGYSEYAKDYRPLIIDQPEDNLDNQYIYRNLVRQLRAVKEKRQVIVATHNATIVTNAKADQVCVMESDNRHGWLETTGYPGEKRIKKHIVNYLEGGKDSFLHKITVYEEALDIRMER